MPRKKENRGGWNKKYTPSQAKKAHEQQMNDWKKANTRCINVRYNLVKDKTILDKLDSVDNKADYIRQLILNENSKSNKFLYTDMTKRALALAYKYHHGQVDKAGMPYIFHPFIVATQMNDEITTTIALLHDMIEDTDITLYELKELFPNEVTDALDLLTYKHDCNYLEYISKIKENENARLVKLADLKHNSDLTRLPKITEKDQERYKKYQQAIAILEN